MPRFFINHGQINGGEVVLTGDDAHHISRALRCAVGDLITVCDEEAVEYTCRLSAFLQNEVRAEILTSEKGGSEPPFQIVLYQALPKGDKMDVIIQKAVECGACCIVPFESEHCVARCKLENEAQKTQRRLRIAAEAAKQCGRSVLPQVKQTISFDTLLHEAAGADWTFFCYEGDGTMPIGKLLATHLSSVKAGHIAIVIGPEGGFSPAEALAAKKAGFLMTGLGKRILRTETASSFILACLSLFTELS